MTIQPDFDRTFRALADGTRRDIVRRAIDSEEGVAELAGHYPMSFAAVQKHVAILEEAGLVHEGPDRATQGRPHQRGGAAHRAWPARPVRGALARRIDRMAALSPREGDSPMTVTAVRRDPEALTLIVDAEFDASPERVWQLWADPRQLERWWGPPSYPATVTAHDLRSGGRVEYHLTGPDGHQPHGYWDVLEADPPHELVLRDGFADPDGTPNRDLPGTRLVCGSRRSAAVAAACRSRATFRAPRRWSRCSPWAWPKACPRRRPDRRDPGSGPRRDRLAGRRSA